MYKTSKYSKKVNQDLEIRTLDVINHSPDALTISQIQQRDMVLANVTQAKMSRVLNKLVDMDFARKEKSKSQKKMVYKATAVMVDQGYEIY